LAGCGVVAGEAGPSGAGGELGSGEFSLEVEDTELGGPDGILEAGEGGVAQAGDFGG
jgi:hypothetical protein